jgi:hypothetical protein
VTVPAFFISALTLFLVVSQSVRLVAGDGVFFLTPLAMGGALLLAALAVPRVKAVTRVLALLLVGTGLLLAVRGNPLPPLRQGLSDALMFSAYLPVIQLLRIVAGYLPAMAVARGRFAGLPPQASSAGFVVGAYGIGTIITTGAHAVLSPLVPSAAPPPDRLRSALASLRGVSLTAFWSPFAVAVAFGSHNVSGAPQWLTLPLGFALAAMALIVAVMMDGGFAGFAQALRGLVPILPGVSLAAVLVVLVATLTGVSGLDAVILVMPLLSVAALAWQARRQFRPALLDVWRSIGRPSDEALLVPLALMLGRLIESQPDIAGSVAPLLAGLPVPALLLFVMGSLIGLGIAGVHPMVTAASLVAIFAGMPGAVSPVSLLQAILVAWGFATMLSPSGVTLIVAALAYKVPYPQLTFSRNLLFAAIVTLLTVLVLSFLDPVFRTLV